MNKRIKATDFEMNFNTGSILYVTIDNFKFSTDKELPNLKIEIENHGVFELIEETDLIKGEIIINHKDLKRVALNWIFNNVEIVAETISNINKFREIN